MINPDRLEDPQCIRYALLEAFIESEEKMSTLTVSYILGISSGHAARVIRSYLTINPDAWQYSALPDHRAWVLSDTYVREYLDMSTDADTYLDTYCELTGMDREDLACYQD